MDQDSQMQTDALFEIGVDARHLYKEKISGSLAQFEKELIRERTITGIEAAKK